MDYLLHHRFITTLERTPTRAALADERTVVTYAQLGDRVGYLVARLAEAGVQRGDRVAFYLDHTVEQAYALLATAALGAAFVPIASALYPEQVAHILADSEARVLLTTAARRASLTGVLSTCTHLQHVWEMHELSGAEPLPRSCPCIEGDLAAILYTSGSTGRPKGVMLSHRNLLAGVDIVSDYLDLSSADRLLGLLPLSFDYGLNQLLTMLAQGGWYRFLTFQFPNQIVDALAAHEITGLAGVPPIWAILARSALARTHLPHLRFITNSGGAVPTRVLDLLRQALPTTQVFLMYGLTEAFRSTYLPPAELDRRPTSMGWAIPDTEILVVGEDGHLCGPGEIGELVHRGPTVALGYWKRPEDTAERFRPDPRQTAGGERYERVVYSGDLVQRDEEGFLHFAGRRDAMLKCAGHRISPTEIEEVVFRSGCAKEAAAIGLADDVAGHLIKVFVVPNHDGQGSPADLGERIIAYCAAHTPSYMVPRFVEVVSAIPKTSSGKTDYPALRTRSQAGQ